ncbi:MAG: LicD family protein [Lachnospiraceae bacterium]|nr:LicD family protein [Lachnospiraceae bacterium]
MENLLFDLEETHSIQIEMLKKLQQLCKAHDLSYFLAFGSLLGAARDGKIIAWDDSIDVVMPFDHYNSLIHLPKEEWGDDIFVQTFESDPQYPRCYAKLRNCNTTLIKSEFSNLDINHGIYINIMPLVDLADDEGARNRQLKNLRLLKAITEGTPAITGGWFLKFYSNLLIHFSPQKMRIRERDRLYSEIAGYGSGSSRYCMALAGDISLKLILPKSWFSQAQECDFEGIKAARPIGWKDWLEMRYGDYMTAPISDLQGNKISDFVTLNAHKPYTYYKGKTYCI